ncbi:hypothetical protein [Desulfovibrio cuneatus]|uniref:hypothetical protein n=1 Tax=Desulfovibrio cuneatus TaxID=159728 RepID=UPI000687D4CB|nr:hypothetical protein [Desulfovibrio cuneatus]
MPNTGTSLTSLAERLKAKTEQERQEMEILTQQQFSALSESLRQSSQNALSTTEAAILHQLGKLEQTLTCQCRTLSRAFLWKNLQALLITVSILLGAGLSGWGLMALAEGKITSLHNEITALSERKETLEAQTAQLWSTFKGLEPFQDKDNKRYLLTPEGWTLTYAGNIEKREAWSIVRK